MNNFYLLQTNRTTSNKTAAAEQLPPNSTADAAANATTAHIIATSSAPASTTAELKCSYKRTAFRPYDGYKTEFLHHSPDVVLFYDVITTDESAILRELASEKVLLKCVYRCVVLLSIHTHYQCCNSCMYIFTL